ncbi:39S ribosomal protein L55, mitochondrial [Clupea harengus]|uniref:39S ribosomal protein L55, mitochondrial n=1 Tax=Clupea harengus TaxID=7950 RepID=A0A6P8FQV8_CLUHA|nr:39S ribosomal protein L55, mitochondrial [Clupea harengus]
MTMRHENQHRGQELRSADTVSSRVFRHIFNKANDSDMALNNTWIFKTCLIRCLQNSLHRHAVVASGLHTTGVHQTSNRTSVVRCTRNKYERQYPVLLVRPDGSTINIRYKEPKRILMMPVDISTLSEEDRKARLRKRDPKKAVVKKEKYFEDDFKIDDYSQFWKKK